MGKPAVRLHGFPTPRGLGWTPGIPAGGAQSGQGLAEAYIARWRYWRAFSGMPSPLQLTALLDWMFSGRVPYLYIH